MKEHRTRNIQYRTLNGEENYLFFDRDRCHLLKKSEIEYSRSNEARIHLSVTRGSGRHSEPTARNERKSPLEGGGSRNESGARRRVLTLRTNEFANENKSPWHQHLSLLKPDSPQGEIFLAKLGRSFWLLILFLMLSFSYTATAQTISQYQQEAAENNPQLKAAYQRYLAALEESPIVGALPDPEVSFAYFIKPIETRVGPQQGRISVSQMLPWFGSLGDRRSVASLKAKARYEEFQEARNRLFYQVERTVLDLYEVDESIRLANENLMILNSLVELSLARYETDRATQVDVLRAQIEQEDLRIQIELLKDNRGVLIQKMKELLNKKEALAISAPDTLTVEYISSREELLGQMQQQNPDLQRLQYQEASSRENRSLAAKQNKPDIMLGVDYIFNGESEMPNVANSGEDALMVMAGFKIPLFGKKNRATLRQADQQVRETQFQLSSRENTLETELDASLRDYEDALRRYQLYDQKQIQRITQAINIMMEAYASDSSDFEEILRMQRKQLSYQLKRVQAITDQHQAKAYIEYLTGKHNLKENIE
ncbi:TolC family protein [Gracilimonas tropica]|uniref:TolC family protein n=1 Tax=Gracilimonas tropica TaxID=454600 RepID=UPI0003816437|nr:TolC family protein [Gracilimonas tropica]